ncbi:MAG: DUF2079 domain-containing protein [Leptolyngbyaceae bacterium]|nr:DUF2079 domain-containing protein [Leptolyngbyaceae bacterium]
MGETTELKQTKVPQQPWWRKLIQWDLSRAVVIGAIAFWVIVLSLLVHRHFSMYPSYASFDQGIFNQVFWNGVHGRPFQSSLSSTLSTPVVHDGQLPEVFYHRLGQHFTPALLLWHPLYALFSSPVTLLVLQVSLITLSGLILYRLARQHLDPGPATFITLGYYCANTVIGPTLANFHDLCQVPLFTFSLFLAFERKWMWRYWLFAFLLLLVREDTGVILFSIGAYWILSRRDPWLGLATCSVALSYILVLTNVVMPLFSEDISRRFMIEQFSPYIDGEEASTIQVMWGLLTRPGQLLWDLVTPLDRTLKYLMAHWLPLLFVPAISPSAWVLNAFPLIKLFVRDDSTALSVNLRYALTVIPGFCYGAILWWSAHPQAFNRWVRRVWIGCLSLAVIFTLTSNPNRALSFIIPDSVQPRVYISPQRQWQHVGVIRRFMDTIPPDASVSTTTHIAPHLSSRREIVRFPAFKLRNDALEEIFVDYILVDLWQLQQYQVVFLDDRERLQQMLPVLDRLIAGNRYQLAGLEDGVVFLQRRGDLNAAAMADWEQYRQELEGE